MQIAITLPDSDVTRLEALAERLTARVRGVTVTRGETIRLAIQRGLEQIEAEEGAPADTAVQR